MVGSVLNFISECMSVISDLVQTGRVNTQRPLSCDTGIARPKGRQRDRQAGRQIEQPQRQTKRTDS